MKRSEALPAGRTGVWRRSLVLAALCVALAAAASSDVLHDALLNVLAAGEQIIRSHPVIGAVLFVSLAAVSAMLAFVSIAVIVPVAVFTWGQPVSIFLLWSGWVLGGLVAWSLSYWLGRPVVRWLAADVGLRRLEAHVGPGTPFSLVLLLQLALPSEIPGYLLGLVRYPLARYLAALAIAELPYALATVSLGANFIERRSGVVLVVGLLLVVFSLVAFQRLRARLRRPAGSAGPGGPSA